MKQATSRVKPSISLMKWHWVCLLLFPASLWAQNTLEQKSDPAGLFSTTNQTFDTNTSVTTRTISTTSGNYAFTHWSINGTRMNDANGQALHKVQFKLLVNSVAIAHYLNNSVDSDADGIPDWREIKTSGNLNQNASSDLDGDGFSLEQEVRFGLNPSIEDNVTEGGISMRRSKKVFVNLGGARKLTVRSDPAGLVSSQITFPEVNSTYNSTSLNGLSNGYYFSHWEINGVRQADSKGVGLSKVSQAMDVDKEVVAKYYEQSLDSDADNIPDWYEMHEFGNLSYNGSSDPDGDGFSLADERKFGLSGVIDDNVTEGGISMRRSKKVFVNLGGASKLTVSSDPAGLVASQLTYPELNSTYTSTSLNGLSNGYYFSHWEVNGVRKADSKGVGLSRVTEILEQDKNLVAKYFEQSLDSDADGIPDWYEMHEFGHLSHDGNSDPDGDGFSLADERRFGLSGVIDDNITEGGISMRRFSQYSYVRDANDTTDTDGDGLTDSQEIQLGTNTQLADTDGDGFSDYQEGVDGTNPLSASSFRNVAPSSIVAPAAGLSVEENRTIGTFVGNFSSTDANDPANSGAYTYSLVDTNGSNDNSKFSLETNGTLTTNQVFDYEALAELNATDLSIRVRVSDSGGLFVENNFTVSILNVVEDFDSDGIEDHLDPDDDNDGFSDAFELAYGSDPRNASSLANYPPATLDLNGSTILENQPAGTTVGQFNATDPDANSTLSFSLFDMNGTHHARFTLDQNGTLRTVAPFDFESNTTLFTLRVRVADERNATLDANFTISILNVVEDLDFDGTEDHFDTDDDGDGFSDADEIAAGTNPRNAKSLPNLPPSTLDLNGSAVLESLAVGSLVGQFTATDPDAHSTLSFALVDGNGSAHNQKFSIDTNGILRTATILDFESNVTTYHVRARVTDEFNATLEGNFTISLLDALPPFLRTLETVGSTGQKITLLGETGIGSGLPLLTYGFQLSQSSLLSNPTIWNGSARTDSNFSTELPLAGLQPDTKYFFRAFAGNAEGTTYGTVQSFLTPPLSTTTGPWWDSLPEIAGGWRTSPWLGTFLAYPQGWIYHADLGWLYAHSGTNADLWLWSSDKGWLWTGPGIYPHLFQNSSASWLYFIKKKDGKPRFYDHTTKSIK